MITWKRMRQLFRELPPWVLEIPLPSNGAHIFLTRTYYSCCSMLVTDPKVSSNQSVTASPAVALVPLLVAKEERDTFGRSLGQCGFRPCYPRRNPFPNSCFEWVALIALVSWSDFWCRREVTHSSNKLLCLIYLLFQFEKTQLSNLHSMASYHYRWLLIARNDILSVFF